MFLTMRAGEWQPMIGDPSFMGWFTVFAYFVTAVICWKTAWAFKREAPPRVIPYAFLFWLGFAGFLFLLGVNKQLDLQTWLTVVAKKLAYAQGWYENRRPVQVVFIVVILAAGVVLLGGLLWLSRKRLRQNWLALAGAVFLGCFILVRASSFHKVDQLLGMRLAGFKMNWALELSGISLIAVAAWRAWRDIRPSSRLPKQDFGASEVANR